MASIPLPALSVHTPEQPNLLSQAGQVMALRGAQGQQQLQQQQLANEKLQNQQQQYQLNATQATNQAYKNAVKIDENGTPQFDTGALTKSLSDAGYGSQLPSIMENLTKYQQAQATLQETKTKVQTANQDAMGSIGNALKAANYDPNLAQTIIQHSLAMPGIPDQQKQMLTQMGQQIQQNPAIVKQLADQFIAQSPSQQKLQNDKDVANIRANGGVENRELNDWLAKNPGKGPADYQAYKVNQQRESEIQKETDPRVLRSKMNLAASEAQIQQTIKNGSAEDAGKMLAMRQVAPSEIAARANPSFLVKANQAALRIDPTYNAMKAEADFKVASSAANSPFFGSAKSLTDKGGTLDQLAAAAKDIPQHDIPVFNTIDDAVKAAGGSGPVAKYASLLIGVSDDYSKVMGGGTGSDASRAQAFQLAKMSASPDQRAAAIEGIRGAVGSQINSRIGNNKVLRNMYGEQPVAAQPSTGAAPQTHTFSVRAWAQANPKGNMQAAKAAAEAQGYQVIP